MSLKIDSIDDRQTRMIDEEREEKNLRRKRMIPMSNKIEACEFDIVHQSKIKKMKKSEEGNEFVERRKRLKMLSE